VCIRWNHETVYAALIARGERVKQSPKDRYVTLYNQKPNCALLYAPDSSTADAPLHVNESRSSWKPEVFAQFANAVELVRIDNKGPGREAHNFAHYRILNWDMFAQVLGL
jgi:hypothetical protein